MVGWAKDRKICLLAPGITDNSLDYMKSVLVHELVHVVFDDHCASGGPLWLSEGVAILYVNQTCDEYVNLDEFPLIREISGENVHHFANRGGYDYAGIYVRHFINKLGIQVFKAAYSGQIVFGDYVDEGFEEEAIYNWMKGDQARGK